MSSGNVKQWSSETYLKTTGLEGVGGVEMSECSHAGKNGWNWCTFSSIKLRPVVRGLQLSTDSIGSGLQELRPLSSPREHRISAACAFATMNLEQSFPNGTSQSPG